MSLRNRIDFNKQCNKYMLTLSGTSQKKAEEWQANLV